jgi:hypothetical protein
LLHLVTHKLVFIAFIRTVGTIKVAHTHKTLDSGF